MNARRLLAGAALAAFGAGCAGSLPPPGPVPHADRGGVVDSVTVALYPFDETGGTRVADAGPFRLNALAGPETRTDFGRRGNSRRFTRSFDSFALAPWNPVFDSRSVTVEAWIYMDEYSAHEDATIASRWGTGAERSWLLAVLGRDLTVIDGPRHHAELTRQRTGRGLLMFAYQPDDASPFNAFFSTRAIELNRWTRVGVTLDGQIVRIFLDGVMDANYVIASGVRPSQAPLLIGNWFDTRLLSDFAGDLRYPNLSGETAHYAFQGLIDDLRISNVARSPESMSDGR